MKKTFFSIPVLFISIFGFAQLPLAPLTVEKIMRDPKWIGTSPSNPLWSVDGKTVYFNWNPGNAIADSVYYITTNGKTPRKLTVNESAAVVYAKDVTYNANAGLYVYAKEDDIFLGESKTQKSIRITQTAGIESRPGFSFNDQKVIYQLSQNLYAWDIATGETIQLTDFQKDMSALENEQDKKGDQQEEWLKRDQLQWIEVLKERKEKKDAGKAYQESIPKKDLKKIYIGNKSVSNMQISADGQFIAYVLVKPVDTSKNTVIPNYVTTSGFTEDISARTKVGAPPDSNELFVFDRGRDTVFTIIMDSLPGIDDLPDYIKDYPRRKQDSSKRAVTISGISWSPRYSYAVVDIRAKDNKDRWLMKLDAGTGRLTLVDRQRDEAWIGGPGIDIKNTGWLNAHTFWFQSEVTGYSHLYTVDLTNGKKTALTAGEYEVQSTVLAGDKKYFYITTNEVHPGEQQFYRLPVAGGKAEPITNMTGANQVTLSPGGKQIAILYSASNTPWELYLQENKPGTKALQVTFKAQTDTFKSYPWRKPELITITARDGQTIYARLYQPDHPHPAKPAVIFVHGAGYLQNAHKWWSSYFREYMFHNLLADHGYYVLDMDYRGSAGYGRNWRTGIYRHMGGKDLTDNMDGAKYLTDKYGVDPKRIGIYGGSYGGFITLMALFTSPGTFAAGAALRPVTDWAHYNHGYTSNILNTPAEDSIAYRRSSPVYFAEGLADHLLICHGVIDVNVHFQDVVRLNQRLIELGKNNWQVAMYPVEDHAFVEASSWTDEYKRIFKLFEEVLKR